jgi:hypothetical protein
MASLNQSKGFKPLAASAIHCTRLALPDACSMLKDSLTRPKREGWLKNAPLARHTPTTGGLTMSYKVTGLRSWNINAEDFESMVRFYRDILGAEETRRHQVAGAT